MKPMKPMGPMIDKNNFDSELLRKYLYGDLSEQELDVLENRLFTDPELSDQLDVLENDLLDECIRGEMDAREQELFETEYLVNRTRRNRLDAARVLHEQLLALPARSAASRPKEPVGIWSSLASAFQPRNLAFSGGIAAFLLFGAIATWMLLGTRDESLVQIDDPTETGNELVNADIASGSEMPETGVLQPEPEPGNKLQNARPESSSNGDKTNGSVNREPKRVFAFTLLPATRSSARAAVNIPERVENVRVTIVHDNQRAFARYRAVLRGSDGNVIRQRGFRVNSSPNAPLIFNVPASLLISGTYEMELSGITKEGRSEALKFYEFNVTR